MTRSTIKIKVLLCPHTVWMSCFHPFFHPNCQQTLPNSDELTFFGLSGIKGYGLTVYGRGPMAPRPSVQHSVETCSIFFFPETYSGLLMRTCGVQLSILCLNKACWWFQVCSRLRIELDESKTPAEESSLELLDSQESWTPFKCDVASEKKKPSFYERCKDKNNTAACSMPEKPTGPPSLYGLMATLLSCLQMKRSLGWVFLLNPMGIAGH